MGLTKRIGSDRSSSTCHYQHIDTMEPVYIRCKNAQIEREKERENENVVYGLPDNEHNDNIYVACVEKYAYEIGGKGRQKNKEATKGRKKRKLYPMEVCYLLCGNCPVKSG